MSEAFEELDGILACDEGVAGVEIVERDLTEQATLEKILDLVDQRPLDLFLSDMAPNISGIALADQARSIGMAEGILDWSCSVLAKDGALLMKVFQGSGFDQLRQEALKHFKSVVTRKPEASRSRSSEVYLLARKFKG